MQGGSRILWIGCEILLRELAVGISARRAAWCVSFLGKLARDGRADIRCFRSGLGRLSFVVSALEWERPLLSPLYTYVSLTKALDIGLASVRAAHGTLPCRANIHKALLIHQHSAGHSVSMPSASMHMRRVWKSASENGFRAEVASIPCRRRRSGQPRGAEGARAGLRHGSRKPRLQKGRRRRTATAASRGSPRSSRRQRLGARSLAERRPSRAPYRRPRAAGGPDTPSWTVGDVLRQVVHDIPLEDVVPPWNGMSSIESRALRSNGK